MHGAPQAFDVDGDGFVEFFMQTWGGVHRVSHEGELVWTTSQMLGSNANPTIADIDKDGNGKLSRNEFPGPDEAWRRLDRNRDGWITQDELQAGRRRPGDRGPQGPPPPPQDD